MKKASDEFTMIVVGFLVSQHLCYLADRLIRGWVRKSGCVRLYDSFVTPDTNHEYALAVDQLVLVALVGIMTRLRSMSTPDGSSLRVVAIHGRAWALVILSARFRGFRFAGGNLQVLYEDIIVIKFPQLSIMYHSLCTPIDSCLPGTFSSALEQVRAFSPHHNPGTMIAQAKPSNACLPAFTPANILGTSDVR